MPRKFGLSLGAAALLSMAMAATTSADVYRVRATDDVVVASFSNFPDGEWESPPPGEYFFADVVAASELASGSEAYDGNFACVSYEAFSVDETGEFWWLGGVFACGPVTTLVIDRRLQSAELVATLPVEDCAAWDEQTGECLEPIELGAVEIDLSFDGIGRIERQHSSSAGGVAGEYSYASHGIGSVRDAIPSGTVTLDGESLIAGATTVNGALMSFSGGWVEISLGG